MNDCLLVKWIWKIHQEPDSLWFQLLKAKYMNGVNFFSSKCKGASQFWQGLHKVKHLFKWGAIFKVGNGKNYRFWQDSWLHDVPLKIYYEDLYKMVRDTECTVFECWVDQDWFIDFRRSLSSIEFQRWTLLYDELQHIALEEHSIDLIF
jgi:hypothetical protein